jgi:hypothetical protein
VEYGDVSGVGAGTLCINLVGVGIGDGAGTSTDANVNAHAPFLGYGGRVGKARCAGRPAEGRGMKTSLGEWD